MVVLALMGAAAGSGCDQMQRSEFHNSVEDSGGESRATSGRGLDSTMKLGVA